MAGAIAARYAAMVQEGRLEPDPAQAQIVKRLDQLAAQLEAHRLARKTSALGWLFSRKAPTEPIRGLYLWGSVGRGKTMLVDLFHEQLQVKRKRRAHFHAFMADVHQRIHAWRQLAKTGQVKAMIRSSRLPRRWPRKPGCCVSMNSPSRTLPMR